ncbi:MAG TPA: adenosylcobinamide-GDP ribazoletransferase [Thermodesulfovibrionales bacterium]|nr:adenosylcobinamide-GDP ribazoletransferase [Thermodesulfovibrionales bacterium]
MKQMLLALQFLTILPVKVRGEVSDMDLAGATIFFPLAGAIQGLLIAITGLAALQIFGPDVVSGIVIIAGLLTSGGFDMDGLIDTFDALAVKATGDQAIDVEKRLTVMKGSTIGAIGAITMAATLLMKYVLLNALFHSVPLNAALCLVFLMPAFSKWVTVPAMSHGIPARKDGLGRIFLDNVRPLHVFLSTFVVVALYLLVGRLYLFAAYGAKSVAFAGTILFGLYIFSLLSGHFCLRKFGGLTGDNFGAMTEISEILFLMAASAWLGNHI